MQGRRLTLIIEEKRNARFKTSIIVCRGEITIIIVNQPASCTILITCIHLFIIIILMIEFG